MQMPFKVKEIPDKLAEHGLRRARQGRKQGRETEGSIEPDQSGVARDSVFVTLPVTQRAKKHDVIHNRSIHLFGQRTGKDHDG